MADLEDLAKMLENKSVSDMTDEELREHLRQIRISRRTIKSNKYGEGEKKKTTSSTPRKTKQNPKSKVGVEAAASLPLDQLEALIAKLEGEIKE